MADEFTIDAKYKRDNLVAEHERYRRRVEELEAELAVMRGAPRDDQNDDDEVELQVRLCPAGRPTFDVQRVFLRVPCRGESVHHDGSVYTVVGVDWQDDGTPLVVAYIKDRYGRWGGNASG